MKQRPLRLPWNVCGRYRREKAWCAYYEAQYAAIEEAHDLLCAAGITAFWEPFGTEAEKLLDRIRDCERKIEARGEGRA